MHLKIKAFAAYLSFHIRWVREEERPTLSGSARSSLLY